MNYTETRSPDSALALVLMGLFFIGLMLTPILLILLRGRESGTTKVSVKSAALFNLPALCPVTGQPTDETRPIYLFDFSMIWFCYVSWKRVEIPFSADGWAKYREQYPLSLGVFRDYVPPIV